MGQYMYINIEKGALFFSSYESMKGIVAYYLPDRKDSVFVHMVAAAVGEMVFRIDD